MVIAKLGIVLGMIVVARAEEAPNRLTPQEAKAGWKLLFDGKSLAGWEPLPTSMPGANGDWTVNNGTILCPGTTAGWLASTDQYRNYVLKLEFRGNAKVNSGVFLRSEKAGAPHVTGHELQIWDDQPAGFNTGSLVGSVKADPVKLIPEQWNQYEITADGDHFVIVLNGKQVLDTHDPKHVSAGVVGFQCQKDNRIEFRNVRVLPLK
jgi:hypothetical protein